MKFLNELNPAQKDAATTIEGPVLILAGAGTGKTKTITNRLAYLLANGIPPDSTLTLTFTNKASKEMRQRAMSLIEKENIPIAFPPKLFTFHKFGLLFLRQHILRLNRNNNFLIIDTDDKKRIIKQFLESDDFNQGFAAKEVSYFKNHLLTPEEIAKEASSLGIDQQKIYAQIANIYQKYQNYLEINNLVDFDDLLKLPFEILRDNEDLKNELSQKYQYIMIDEFQDTNELQFRLLKLLCATHNNLCVVGDDDQSIYGWRGANIKNILEFDTLFENTKVVKLEENYRSTEKILECANQLISHNKNRHQKVLKATHKHGKEIGFDEYFDEKQEAETIAQMVQKLIDSGVRHAEIAILYRINALSRSIEEGLLRRGINFNIIDSVRFYERMEVKDAISYFRAIVNPHDDFSLKRIINKPKRGIGKTTVEKLETKAQELQKSMFEIIYNSPSEDLIALVGKKNEKTLKEFSKTLLDLKSNTHIDIEDFIEEFEKKVNIRDFYGTSKEEERALNIDELYGAIVDHIRLYPDHEIEEFLNDIALQSDQDKMGIDQVNLMTIHAAKGLEFEHVFVIGLEEGFFPVIGETTDMEEERRLGYVAFTRAKKELSLSSVKSRFFRGKRKEMNKSRFLAESGIVKGGFSVEDKSPFKKGDLVKHKIFGMGRVIGANKAGQDYKLKINFGGSQKEILSDFVEKI